MISENLAEQYLQCTLCGEVTEISRKIVADAETRMILVDKLKEDHADCGEWADDPERCRAERTYKVRMRNELDALNKRENSKESNARTRR